MPAVSSTSRLWLWSSSTLLQYLRGDQVRFLKTAA
jgi:hypothetical protein